MKHLRPLLCVLGLLMTFNTVFAQKKELKVKFGKHSDEQLNMQSYAPDPEVPAVVFFDKGELSHRYVSVQGKFMQDFERHTRMKIFKKSALDMANFYIFYFDYQKVTDIKGAAWNLENGKWTETELTKDNIFDEKITKSRHLMKITIPGVKEGSVVELKYTISTDGLANLPDWTFQQLNAPVLWSEFEAEVPTFIDFKKVARGATPFLVADENQTQKTIGTSLFYDVKTMRFVQENVPPLKPEPYMPAPRAFLSQINFDISAVYKIRVEQQGPSMHLYNGAYTEYNNTWAKFGKEMMDDVYEDPIQSGKYTKETALQLVAGQSSVADKVATLYQYVGANYTEKDFDLIWMTQSLEDLVKNKKGTASELNVLLLNMLDKAGVKAWPVLLSTRSNGPVNPIRVSPDEMDRLIVAVEGEDGKWLLADAAAYPNPVGLLDEEDLNYQGLLIKPDGAAEWIEVSNKIGTKSLLIADIQVLPEGGVKANITSTEGGYGAANLRKNIKAKDLSSALGKQFPAWTTEGSLEQIKIEQGDQWNDPAIKTTFVLQSGAHAAVSGDKIYLSPAIGLGTHHNPFNNPERHFNIDLGIPHDETYSFVWHIPAGYKVEEQPQSAKMVYGENALTFEYLVESAADGLKISVRTKIRKPYILLDGYEDLRRFYTEMVAKMEENIVLTRI